MSGAFLSFAIVIGEFILAQYLVKPAFAPYMAYLMQQKAYEPAALAIISFALTWASMGIIQLVGRGNAGTSGRRTLTRSGLIDMTHLALTNISKQFWRQQRGS